MRGHRLEQFIMQYTYQHQRLNKSLLNAQKSAGELNHLFQKKAEKPADDKKKD